MRLNFDEAILDQMAEGVILLDRQARIVSNNKAAQFWLQACRQLAPALKRLIDEEVAGRLIFPIAIDKLVGAHAASKIQTKAWLCKNGRRDFAIFIVPPKLSLTSEPHPESADKRFVTLFGDQIRQQLAEFRAAMGAQGSDCANASLLKKAKRLDYMLQEISNLAQLMQRDQVFASERLELDALISGILAQESTQHAVHHVFTPGSAPQGVLYGDADWLTYALRALIQSLWQGAPPQSHVAISTRQLGDFIVVSGQTGFGCAPGQAPGGANPAAVDAITPGEASVRMLMCQRIVELHSGFLKVKSLAGANADPAKLAAAGQGVESFVLTLMSGLPEHERSRASCSDCRLNLQAQAYAQDLALLMEQLQTTSA